jgi:hypothetical protein
MEWMASHLMALGRIWTVKCTVCDATCTMIFSPFWCDTQWFEFFTFNRLDLHVWVVRIQQYRIIFFASIRVLRESLCIQGSKICDWCWSRTYIVKCRVCFNGFMLIDSWLCGVYFNVGNVIREFMMLNLVHLHLHNGRSEFIMVGGFRSCVYLYAIFSVKEGCAVICVMKINWTVILLN